MNSIAWACCERTSMEAGGVKVFTLRIQGAQGKFQGGLQAGRHVALRHLDASGALQQRLYSITRKQDADVFEIAVKRSGRSSVSDHMHTHFKEGSIIPLEYVAGDISIDSVSGLERVGMIAGGIGITLPIALLREIANLARSGQRVPETVLLLCIPRIADIPFLHELLELNLTSTWFTLHLFITQDDIQARDRFHSGRPTADSLLRVMGQPQAVVICGSHGFAQTFRDYASSVFPSARLLIEAFTPPQAQVHSNNESADRPIRLHFADTDEVIEAASGNSLLEILESAGRPVRSQCRAGICGNCRIKVSGGQCRFEPDFCLSENDKSRGYALACCAFPLSGDISIDLTATA